MSNNKLQNKIKNKKGGNVFENPLPGVDPINPIDPILTPGPINELQKPINKSLKPSNLKINICYQTFTSLVFAFICIFIQVIVFKKYDVSYINVILLIFVWPLFIEMLCRGLELNKIAWLLSIIPVLIVIIYDTVTYINDKKDKDKKDKEKDYERTERLNEKYEILDILNYY